MAGPIDFPADPIVGQLFAAPNGFVYRWNGAAWTTGFFDNPVQDPTVLGGFLWQVRTLLQDTDLSSGAYRYPTDGLVTNLNQAMMDLYRIRPDLFLALSFQIPVFNTSEMATAIGIEMQYIPSLIYYVVGLTQARDDEQNQDARAMGFLKVFQTTIVNGGLAPPA